MNAGERFVVLGLAHVRSGWFREVARWATSAVVPCEFVKCVSVEEARARLASGRPFSALLVDGSLPGIDRDLFDAARSRGCAVFVVDDGRVERSWEALGAVRLLGPDLDPHELIEALETSTRPISRRDAVSASAAPPPGPGRVWQAPLLAVTGAGGTGASTIAMAIAQGLAADARNAGMVLLADLALHGDLAMLHDAGDVVPGLQELVDAHRAGRPTPDEIRAHMFEVPGRRYHLLLGLRRHRDWAAVRPRAIEAALEAVRSSYRYVVADVDADIEGEEQCGSIDVEERNALARVTLSSATAVAVVGLPGPKGVHALARTIRDLAAFGVQPGRILPVVARASRRPRHRAHLARAIAALAMPPDAGGTAPAVFVPEHKRLDDVIRDGARLPAGLAALTAGAVLAVLDHAPARDPATAQAPQPVRPGSLGRWATT